MNLRGLHLGSTARPSTQRFDGIRFRDSVLAFGERDDLRAGTFGRTIDSAVGWYIAGFVDGEGCFFIGKESCSFIIKLRADDRDLLEWIRDQLGGVGTIRSACEKVGNRNAQVVLTVTRRTEVLWLTEFFDAFSLVGKKRRDYAVWREAVIERFNGMPAAHLVEYKARLSQVRAYEHDLPALVAEAATPSKGMVT